MKTARVIWTLLLIPTLFWLAGCASTPPADSARGQEKPEKAIPDPEPAARPHPTQTGRLRIDVCDAAGAPLPARVDLEAPQRAVIPLSLPKGSHDGQQPVGEYTAFIHVYDMGLPVLVDIQEVTVRPEGLASVTYALYEGMTEQTPLRAFDADGDLVLDRVEAEAGTSHEDPAEYPGAVPLNWESRVLSDGEGWLRGELFARSEYDHSGAQSVKQAIARAEKLGLDFLAIADANTMASLDDPAYRSDSVVLIPAMAWGNDERGWALIYGPKTLPDPPHAIADAQGVCWRTQAQGGVFAVAHPCFPTAPWQWGVQYVNAVQVWCREWSKVPPITMDALDHNLTLKSQGELAYSIARAASAADLSANGQATKFWDFELSAGLQACAVGGSGTSNGKTPMAQPATYVYAEEKSVRGILDGIRAGRTFVSSRPGGPTVLMRADILRDESAETSQAVKDWRDAYMGMTVPSGLPTRLVVLVDNAAGKTLDVLENGSLIASRRIDSDHFGFELEWNPTGVSAVRARVTEPNFDAKGNREGFGFSRALALSSPIYAQPMLYVDPNRDPEDYRIRIHNDFSLLQSVYSLIEPSTGHYGRGAAGGGRHYIAPYEMPPSQPGAGAVTIEPQVFE